MWRVSFSWNRNPTKKRPTRVINEKYSIVFRPYILKLQRTLGFSMVYWVRKKLSIEPFFFFQKQPRAFLKAKIPYLHKKYHRQPGRHKGQSVEPHPGRHENPSGFSIEISPTRRQCTPAAWQAYLSVLPAFLVAKNLAKFAKPAGLGGRIPYDVNIFISLTEVYINNCLMVF